ncbi:hypothetical protein PoB_000862500 [Plakobranchus ocellatus]|uniref:Uncharacterized protein n=1 Tax=Plakobranchus ocellatus TaxID=259542 RepID=A0AAV3YHW0_9GAST|nr:hypothetical protein PoB_000862500 [Plakobranchus ocellatus]
MSRNVVIAPSFFAYSFDFNSTMRSPLPCLVTSMVSSPRIDFNSLWILKGDLSATFADPLELITINFLNGDQPAKGDMFIKEGRSSAAPRAASVQGFFATSGRGEGSGVFFCLVMRKVLGISSRAPRPPRSPTRGTRCAALQRCVRATLELYSQQRVWDLYWD